MNKQRFQLPPLDIQDLTHSRNPNLHSNSNGSKECPVTPSTAAQTARSVIRRQPLSPQLTVLSARETSCSRRASWRSESNSISAGAAAWSHRSSSPNYPCGTAPSMGKTHLILAVPTLKSPSTTAVPSTPLSGRSSRSPPVPQWALPVAMATPSAGVAARGSLAAKEGRVRLAVPSKSTQVLEPNKEARLQAYIRDLHFDSANQAKKLPAAPCAEVALPSCVGYALRAYAAGAVKPPTLESSFFKVQEEDDWKMLQQGTGGNENCRRLQLGDAERMQQDILRGKEHCAYYVGLTGKPQPHDDSFVSRVVVAAAPWYSEGKPIPYKIMPTAGTTTALTVDDDAKNGGPTFNDKLLGSQIASGDAKHGGRIHGIMYEYAPGLGRVQTIYCESEDGVLYPLIVLPKMTPFDILRWKARKDRKTREGRWNPFRWCSCIELIEIEDERVWSNPTMH